MDSLKPDSLFVKHFKGKNLSDLVVVSPDAGGAKAAKKLADKLGADLAMMHKTRPSHQEAEIVEVVGDIEGKTAVLYDDMIDSAGSICAAKKALVAHGANPDVYAAATHAIFSGPAVDRLKEAGFKEVVVTDSLPVSDLEVPGLVVLPIAPMLAEVIEHVVKGESVTEIYK
jgi:ribose-phosphate pyrophosphokinase